MHSGGAREAAVSPMRATTSEVAHIGSRIVHRLVYNRQCRPPRRTHCPKRWKGVSDMPGPRVLALLLLAAAAHAQEASIRSRDPVAWWPLDEVAEQGSSDRASRVRDRLEGNYRLVDGVVGKAVSFDGYTTVLRRVAASAPALADAFTIEAWVAVGAYPWNVVPIVDHGDEQLRGFVFGLGPRGELSLRIAVDGRWLEATSPDGAVPLRQWSHVAARYDASAGLALFVDGRIVGRQVPPDPAGLGGRSARRGRVIPADGLDLLVGAVRAPRRPI